MLNSFLTIPFIILTACSTIDSQNKNQTSMAVANLKSPNSKITGTVTLEELKDEIKITTNIKGLKPGSVHGFHIHENGKCDSPTYKSAGNHFSTQDSIHGGPKSEAKHTGDLGNIVADSNGLARKEIVIHKKEIKDINTLTKRAVIIHQNPDDLVSQPSGNAGDRIACGIIEFKPDRAQ